MKPITVPLHTLTQDGAITTDVIILVPVAEVCRIPSVQFDSIGVTIDSLLKLIQFQIGIPCVCVVYVGKGRHRYIR